MRERDKKLSLALSIVWCLILLLVSSVVKIISAVRKEGSEWLFLSRIFFCFLLTWQNTYRATHCHGYNKEACCCHHMPEWQWYWWEDRSPVPVSASPYMVSALTYSVMLHFSFFISRCRITLHRKKCLLPRRAQTAVGMYLYTYYRQSSGILVGSWCHPTPPVPCTHFWVMPGPLMWHDTICLSTQEDKILQ